MKYSQKRYNTFAKECEEAKLEVFDYHGRNFYSGPAVTVDDIQVAIRATTVDCQWDSMGKSSYVVYPK